MLQRKLIEADLLNFLAKRDAYWKWDNHAHVALLTSGKVSDLFVNCTPVFTVPGFQLEMAVMLVALADDIDHTGFRRFIDDGNVWVVGSAMGGIGLAQAVANAVHMPGRTARAAYTEPEGNGMVLKRFHLGARPKVLLVEDVFTTGGTTRRTMQGIVDKHPDVEFYPQTFALVNRATPGGELSEAGHTVRMFGLADVEARVWDSMEDVPEEMRACIPIRPKGNWQMLTQEMLSG